MGMLSDRDSRLHDLSNKSSSLQFTSDAFNRQAKYMHWELRWQKLRLWILASLLSLWAVLFYFCRRRLTLFIVASITMAVLLYLAERRAVARWREPLDAKHA